MSGKIENSGNSWWSHFCCGGESDTQQRTERNYLIQSINDNDKQDDSPPLKRQDSPQPSYNNYLAGNGGDSPLPTYRTYQTGNGGPSSPLK